MFGMAFLKNSFRSHRYVTSVHFSLMTVPPPNDVTPPMPQLITIVIRARNEAKLIGVCLREIFGQRCDWPFEVIVIDSGSTDDTVRIAESHSRVRVHQISPDEFNYGGTLNLGVELAKGEFIVALSAHCVPTGSEWLQSLVRPLVQNPRVAGTFGKQIPWPHCEFIEKCTLASTFPDTPFTQQGAQPHDGVLSPVFSNANSCFRGELARENLFKLLPHSEDRIWAFQMLNLGHEIAYVPEASVFHSHNRGVIGYYRLGYSLGMVRPVLGLPPLSLSDLRCSSIKQVFWIFDSWMKQANDAGYRGFRKHIVSLHAVARQVAKLVGMRNGARQVMEPIRLEGIGVNDPVAPLEFHKIWDATNSAVS